MTCNWRHPVGLRHPVGDVFLFSSVLCKGVRHAWNAHARVMSQIWTSAHLWDHWWISTSDRTARAVIDEAGVIHVACVIVEAWVIDEVWVISQGMNDIKRYAWISTSDLMARGLIHEVWATYEARVMYEAWVIDEVWVISRGISVVSLATYICGSLHMCFILCDSLIDSWYLYILAHYTCASFYVTLLNIHDIYIYWLIIHEIHSMWLSYIRDRHIYILAYHTFHVTLVYIRDTYIYWLII